MNGGGVLKVNPRALQNIGSSFGQTGDGLAGLQADAPLGDAAGAVPQLETGDACRKAQIDVAAKTAALAEGARKFGDNLHAAAGWYQTRDQAAAGAIKKVEIPE